MLFHCLFLDLVPSSFLLSPLWLTYTKCIASDYNLYKVYSLRLYNLGRRNSFLIPESYGK